MLNQVLLGSALVLLTSLIHAGGMLIAIRVLRTIHPERLNLESHLLGAILTAGVVLMMFSVGLLESLVWAYAYIAVGAFSELEQAFYFSMVVFTTLGFGDVTLGETWRVLSTFEAANGIIMFGWTTALIFAFVQRLISYMKRAGKPGS